MTKIESNERPTGRRERQWVALVARYGKEDALRVLNGEQPQSTGGPGMSKAERVALREEGRAISDTENRLNIERLKAYYGVGSADREDQ